jgi:hypothetical protein
MNKCYTLYLNNNNNNNNNNIQNQSQWPRGLRPLTFWDCGFESCRGHVCLSLVSVVCCQVEVSASD